MNILKKLFHPLIAFIGIQLVWVLVVVFWIYWFIGSHQKLRKLAEHYRPEMVVGRGDWLVLAEGIILLLVILGGVYIIFLYWNRQVKLYSQQRAFISQVTHELKSPLASLQLHLETIRLRKPSPEKLDSFVDTMLADSERLNNLINNLLLAAKLEQKQDANQRQVVDLSAFVSSYLEQKRTELAEGATITLKIEPGIKAAIDMESMEMVLRNLLENAVLYSPVSPEITVSLTQERHRCRLVVEDKGKGIGTKELKRVFRMFYRIRRPGENVRGTGLGLYIVKSVVKEHGGTINVTSEGEGKGTQFHMTLPTL